MSGLTQVQGRYRLSIVLALILHVGLGDCCKHMEGRGGGGSRDVHI